MGFSQIGLSYDSFRLSITDPHYFVGRAELIDTFVGSPIGVYLLLGSRRLGKTSALRALECTLLNQKMDAEKKNTQNFLPFPAYFNLAIEQPEDAQNFYYLLLSSLDDAIRRYRQVPWEDLRATYRKLLSQVVEGEASIGILKLKVKNPAHQKRCTKTEFEEGLLEAIDQVAGLGFRGISFLVDEAEYLVKHSESWGEVVCSYVRHLLDTNAIIRPFVCFMFSGYRGVRNYEQKAGSPLANIANLLWLGALDDFATDALLRVRAQDAGYTIDPADALTITEFSGGHPFLTQTLVSDLLLDKAARRRRTAAEWLEFQLQQHHADFLKWWNPKGESDGLGENERCAYRALLQSPKANADDLRVACGFSKNVTLESLRVLAATGIIRRVDEQRYACGSSLFAKWVGQQPS